MRSTLAAAIALLMSAGCVSIHVDGDKFLVGYSARRTYETRMPLILMWERASSGVSRGRNALVVPPDTGLPIGGRLYCGPPAANPWVSPALYGNCWQPEDVIAVVPKGTLLVVDRIERMRGWNVWYGKQDDLIPFATLIVNGLPTDAEISDLSRWETRRIDGHWVELPVADPEILRESAQDSD